MFGPQINSQTRVKLLKSEEAEHISSSTSMASSKKSKLEVDRKKKKNNNKTSKTEAKISKPETSINKTKKKVTNTSNSNSKANKKLKTTPVKTNRKINGGSKISNVAVKHQVIVTGDDSSCGSRESSKKNARNEIAEEINLIGVFPMARIKRIIQGQGIDSVISQEAVYLVNKASELFIEHFSEDTYNRSVQDRKKALHYDHLSSVVSKQKRYDFLSDFVPEKVKAEDALAE